MIENKIDKNNDKTSNAGKINTIIANRFIFVLITVGLIAILISAGLLSAAESNLQATVQVLGQFITIYSPIEGKMYNTKNILLNASLSEKVAVLLYKINTGGYSKLCTACSKYAGTKSFAEGQNNLTVRAITYNGSQFYSYITFYTDTTKPKIIDTSPSSYGNGMFGVKYTEINLEKVRLFYGKNYSDLENSKTFLSCMPGTNIWCFDNADVSMYEGQYIYYQFLIKDRFYSVYSNKIKILIDTIAPVLNVYSPKNKNYTNAYNYVYINLTANEKSKLEYSDNSRSWTSLCSSCTSYKNYKTFSFGQHNVTFRATDLAGNRDEEIRSFNLSKY